MRCARCGVEFEGKFCPNCGAPAQYSAPPTAARCQRCGYIVYGSYCTHCGLPTAPPQPAYYQPYPVRATRPDEVGRIVSASWLIYFIIFFTAFVAFIGLLWASASLVIPGILDGMCEECLAYLLIITPRPIPIIEPFGGIPFLAYYLLVLVTISACFFYLVIKDMPQVISDFKISMKKGWFSSRSKSTLMLIGQLFAFGVFFNVGYNFLILIFMGEGVLPSDTEITPPWYFLSSVATAAVWEEIITRTLLIGLPLFVIDVVKPKKLENPARYFIGGGFKIGFWEGTFLFFSAIMFGMAHTYRGGPWVFPPLFVGGLILGYLFLKKGIVTSILFHFIWNYSIAFNYIASINNNYVLLGLGVSFTLFVAFIGFILTFSFFMRRIKSYQKRAQAQQTTQPQGQAPYQTGSYTGYQCPSCGWTYASYREGRFQCLRCGHIT